MDEVVLVLLSKCKMMQQLLTTIVGHDILHGKWLNALSYLENTGARKISAYQDSYGVNYLELKHAAEEHRYAYYLKKQLRKLPIPFFPIIKFKWSENCILTFS